MFCVSICKNVTLYILYKTWCRKISYPTCCPFIIFAVLLFILILSFIHLCLFFTFTPHTISVCYTRWWTAPRSHDKLELGCVRRQPAGVAGHSTLSRRLSDFYEYMYTAQSGGGFVFISLGDTSAAAPLHLFHLRRLRLALQVRSHHASMLPRHHSAAERAQALLLPHPIFSTGNFHQFLVFASSSSPRFPWSSVRLILPRCGVCCGEARTGVNTAPGTARSLTLCQNRCASGQEVWGRC